MSKKIEIKVGDKVKDPRDPGFIGTVTAVKSTDYGMMCDVNVQGEKVYYKLCQYLVKVK